MKNDSLIESLPAGFRELAIELLEVADCVKIEQLEQVERLIECVSNGSIAAFNIKIEDARAIGCADTLIRMQRNMNSAVMLLRIVKDAMMCARSEESAIYDSMMKHISDEQREQKEKGDRLIRSLKEKIKNDRKAAKRAAARSDV